MKLFRLQTRNDRGIPTPAGLVELDADPQPGQTIRAGEGEYVVVDLNWAAPFVEWRGNTVQARAVDVIESGPAAMAFLLSLFSSEMRME